MPSFPFLPLKPQQLSSRNGRQRRSQPAETGQSLAILAIMMLALLAFVGLAADSGILYVTYAQLRRAVDAGALAATSQWRKAHSDITNLQRSAEEAMRLQGLPAPINYTVETCESVHGRVPDEANGGFSDPLIASDPVICTYPARKLVRVSATADANFAFMRLWGWNKVTLRASATSEAAALDVMLILDISYSMTWDASLTNTIDDDQDGCVNEEAGAGCDANGLPDDYYGTKAANGHGIVQPVTGPGVLPDTTPNCNTGAATSAIAPLQAAGKLPLNLNADLNGNPLDGNEALVSPLTPCRPFEYVRDAALRFVMTYLDLPYDRVGIVTFASAPCPPGSTGAYATWCGQNQTSVRQSIGDGYSLPDSIRALSVGGATSYGTLSPLEVSSRPPCHGDGSQKDTLFPNLWDGGAPGAVAGDPDAGDYGECENTDTGDGLKFAFDNLNLNLRSNAVRFMILLSDGAASTSAYDAAQAFNPSAPAYDGTYACPNEKRTQFLSDGSPNPFWDQYFSNRPCVDGDARNFYVFRHSNSNDKYDADDYARDQADAIAASPNATVIYTIGLGAEVTDNPGGGGGCSIDVFGTLPDKNSGNPDCMANGEQLLRYIADKGDGINPPDPDPCLRSDSPSPADPANPTAAELTANPNYSLYLETTGKDNCGNYFYAAAGLNVRLVFEQIAQRIFTRLTQ